jgi:acetate kinase
MMRILVVNAGSSTLKLRVLGPDDAVEADHLVDPWGGDEATAAGAIGEVLRGVGSIEAVGHRVVHGGSDLVAATPITAELVERISALTPLAPLHQPRALAGIGAARARLPAVTQVACFDTAFHATLPAAARTYALPAAWRERWELRRFGFHGLSHAWAARRAVELSRGRPHGRIVTCHLGAGASLCAVLDGRSVDTTMGFTPLEGLVMATRSGSVDPGLVLWLLTEAGLDAPTVTAGLEHDAGLAGLSGTSGDLRAVLEARGAGDARARLAVDVYVHRLRREVAAMVASLGGLDALVFTGGVGEHAPAVRAEVAAGLAFLGVGVDPIANETGAGDRSIAPTGAIVDVLVVAAREDLQIAHEVRAVVPSISA